MFNYILIKNIYIYIYNYIIYQNISYIFKYHQLTQELSLSLLGVYLHRPLIPIRPDGFIEACHRPVSESCCDHPSTGRPTNLEAWHCLLTPVMVDGIPLL